MSSDQLSDDEEQRLWQHKHFGMNVVQTPPMDQSIAHMPADFAHLAMGPVQQMVRMPDLPNGEALWISRDALRYCIIMSDQTWVARLHTAAPRLQGILQDTTPINWWNVYFETESERSTASATNGAAVPGTLTTQGFQTSSAQRSTDQQPCGNRPHTIHQASQSWQPVTAQGQQASTISGRASAHGGVDTRVGAGFLSDGSIQGTSSAAQVPSTAPQSEIFNGGYGNAITGPPAPLQYGVHYRAGQGQSLHGSIVDGGRGVAGGVQQPTHARMSNSLPALPHTGHPPQIPPASFSNDVNAGTNAGEEASNQSSTPSRGRPSPSRDMSRGRGFGTSRGSSAGERRGSATRGGLTRRQEFNIKRMAELANGTAVQTAPPVQALLDRDAPLVQNGPIPNPLALAGGLRQEFGGSDLSRPGPFFTRNAATGAGAIGSNQAGNAVQAGNVNRGGNGPDLVQPMMEMPRIARMPAAQTRYWKTLRRRRRTIHANDYSELSSSELCSRLWCVREKILWHMTLAPAQVLVWLMRP